MGLTSELFLLFSCLGVGSLDGRTDLGCFDSPEWKRLGAQIWGPGQTYKWESSWTFGLV
jgi:hypothetical protein